MITDKRIKEWGKVIYNYHQKLIDEKFKNKIGLEIIFQAIDLYYRNEIRLMRNPSKSVLPSSIVKAVFAGNIISKKIFSQIGYLSSGADIYVKNREILEEKFSGVKGFEIISKAINFNEKKIIKKIQDQTKSISASMIINSLIAGQIISETEKNEIGRFSGSADNYIIHKEILKKNFEGKIDKQIVFQAIDLYYRNEIRLMRNPSKSVLPSSIVKAVFVGKIISKRIFSQISYLSSGADIYVRNKDILEENFSGVKGFEIISKAINFYEKKIIKKIQDQTKSISASMVIGSLVAGQIISESEKKKLGRLPSAVDIYTTHKKNLINEFKGKSNEQVVFQAIDLYYRNEIHLIRNPSKSVLPSSIIEAVFAGSIISKKIFSQIGYLSSGADIYVKNREILEERFTGVKGIQIVHNTVDLFFLNKIPKIKKINMSISPSAIINSLYVGKIISKVDFKQITFLLSGADIYVRNKDILETSFKNQEIREVIPKMIELYFQKVILKCTDKDQSILPGFMINALVAGNIISLKNYNRISRKTVGADIIVTNIINVIQFCRRFQMVELKSFNNFFDSFHPNDIIFTTLVHRQKRGLI